MSALDSMEARAHGGADSKAEPIDLDHLHRYTLGDRSLEREILNLFLGQLSVTISVLKSAPSAKAWDMAAHTLKGSARAVGAWSLAALAEHAEGLGHRSQPGERKQMLTRLEEAAEKASAYIATLGDGT